MQVSSGLPSEHLDSCSNPCTSLLVGAPLSGWISDKIVIKYKKERGFWYPEDRLRACFFGAFLPLTVLAPGLITKFVPGRLGLALNLTCLFMNGIGVSLSFLCLLNWRNNFRFAYRLISRWRHVGRTLSMSCIPIVLVQLLPSSMCNMLKTHKMQILADITQSLYSAFRSILLSFAIGMLLPTINRYGYLFTSTVVSLLALLTFG